MSYTLRKWVVVCAIILGMGAHWAILQSVAWTGMMISYSQCSTFKEALRKTFNGQHPCKLCQVVRAARNSERDQKNQVLSLKLDPFVARLPARLLFPPTLEPVSTSLLDLYCSSVEAPPTPPPIRA